MPSRPATARAVRSLSPVAMTMRNPRSCSAFSAAGVPIAAGVLYPFFGILIGPIFAAFAMSASSLSVVLNALRLRHAPL
jgi:Cu+-exporting ATPase